MDEPVHGAANRRPWQLIAVGFGLKSLTPATARELERIFELCPELPMLTISTASGEGFTVSRDFPSDAPQEVDDRLARIFRENPAIAAITFPAQGKRPAHAATPQAPFGSPTGEESAAILTAIRAGEITPDEASKRLYQLFRRYGEDPEPSSSSP